MSSLYRLELSRLVVAAEMLVVADVATLESLGAHQSYRRMASAAAVTSQ